MCALKPNPGKRGREKAVLFDGGENERMMAAIAHELCEDWRKGLTGKQQRFVEEYCGDAKMNATEAAIRSYDTEDRVTAASIGYENLRIPQIVDAIALYTSEAAEEAKYGREAFLQDLFELRDKSLGRAQLGDGSSTFSGASGGKALDLLGKYFGWLVEKVEQVVPDDVIVRHFGECLGSAVAKGDVKQSAVLGMCQDFERRLRERSQVIRESIRV